MSFILALDQGAEDLWASQLGVALERKVVGRAKTEKLTLFLSPKTG